jgi:hypothetical protein
MVTSSNEHVHAQSLLSIFFLPQQREVQVARLMWFVMCRFKCETEFDQLALAANKMRIDSLKQEYRKLFDCFL